jgi:hypothetical protein
VQYLSKSFNIYITYIMPTRTQLKSNNSSRNSSRKTSRNSIRKTSRNSSRNTTRKLSRQQITEFKKIREAQRRTSKNPCPKGQILRKGYRRRSYTRSNSPRTAQTHVKETYVRPVCIQDRGQPGYGAQVIPPLTPNLLGQFGYSTYASQAQRRKSLNDAINNIGLLEIYRHLRDIITLQRWNPRAHDIMLDDFNYLRRKYYPDRIGKYKTVGY